AWCAEPHARTDCFPCCDCRTAFTRKARAPTLASQASNCATQHDCALWRTPAFRRTARPCERLTFGSHRRRRPPITGSERRVPLVDPATGLCCGPCLSRNDLEFTSRKTTYANQTCLSSS